MQNETRDTGQNDAGSQPVPISQPPLEMPPAAPSSGQSSSSPIGVPTSRDSEGLRPDTMSVAARQTEESTLPRIVQPVYQTDVHEPVYMPLALSVGAGFKFGCGLLLAFAMATLTLFLIASVIFFVAALVGIPIPFG